MGTESVLQHEKIFTLLFSCLSKNTLLNSVATNASRHIRMFEIADIQKVLYCEFIYCWCTYIYI